MFKFFKNINRVLENNKDEILDKKGVEAIGIGTKITDGKDTGEKAIVVFVERKKDIMAMMAEDVVPKTIEGYKTDIIDLGGEIEPMHRLKHRPVISGISAMVKGGSACTLGLVVYKDGKPHALTNEHCIHHPAGTNQNGNDYIQQSPADGGVESVGKINSNPTLSNIKQNRIDSAIIPLSTESISKVRLVPNYTKKWKDAKVGDQFLKPSRTTNFTKGIISHTNMIARVNYGGSLGVCEFYPTMFALQNNYNIVDGGDSGSVIFDEEGNAIGQTFAAAPNLAIFLPFSSVVSELGIELDKTEEAYIALGSWLEFNRLDVKTKAITNLRREPKIGSNIIKKLPTGTVLKIIEFAGVSDNYFWIKVII